MNKFYLRYIFLLFLYVEDYNCNTMMIKSQIAKLYSSGFWKCTNLSCSRPRDCPPPTLRSGLSASPWAVQASWQSLSATHSHCFGHAQIAGNCQSPVPINATVSTNSTIIIEKCLLSAHFAYGTWTKFLFYLHISF